MSLSSVGAAMGAQSQQQTLEAVNVSLLKQSQNQQQQMASELLQSVAPASSASSPESNLGQHVDVRV